MRSKCLLLATIPTLVVIRFELWIKFAWYYFRLPRFLFFWTWLLRLFEQKHAIPRIRTIIGKYSCIQIKLEFKLSSMTMGLRCLWSKMSRHKSNHQHCAAKFTQGQPNLCALFTCALRSSPSHLKWSTEVLACTGLLWMKPSKFRSHSIFK